MPANTTEVEKKLWESADQLRANSNLKSSEYSVPVLGLIFLRFADQRFTQYENVHHCLGRFDFVMANSASDARASELDIRRKLIEAPKTLW